MAQFVMYLNAGKVVKYFGTRPHLGRRIAMRKKRVTVGVKWSLPKKDYIPDDDVLVSPTVALTCVGKNMFRVSVEDAYREQATDWLMEKCQ